MMNTNAIPDDCQSNDLFLLVGTNPLPNYVAALLLTRPSGTVHLLYSSGAEGGTSTKRFADFLETELSKRRPDLQVRTHGISEVSERAIHDRLNRVLDRATLSDRVSLNYTGGTKPMAVHSYRILERLGDDPVFSYLDARRLAIFFDGVDTPYPVGQALQVSFQELAALHGYEMAGPQSQVQHEPLVRALAEVHSTKEGYDQWKAWLSDLPLDALPNSAKYPALEPVRSAMDTLCGGTATPAAVARLFDFEELTSCWKWLNSTWLEELALAAIRDNTHLIPIEYYGRGVEPLPSSTLKLKAQPKKFDLDVAAILGYQLFAVSCIVRDDHKGETKKHLFEAYVRARQLGGDESRVALLSCVPTPDIVQQEIERDWHAEGQIRVFGRRHLTQLATHIHHWFKQMGAF